ncbi:protein SCO1/2 [Alloyangia pacifica]|uniref:Protein SCO1/2 n=1 Tax=Alloyangia pacifica TaxID=311180 RepID=A0A1I6VGL2_9RHOB|nr:protein SCO1/2 [Alloyangia pacifica]SFT12809.1 protein SCO1/2 [Alloyangia pacifica]
MRCLHIFLSLCLWTGSVSAHDGKTHAPVADGEELETTVVEAELVRSDAPLLDQFGRATTLTDALGDGLVVLSFTYTNCESLCGLADMVLGALLSHPARPDTLRILTLTLDPARDSPAELLKRHEAFGAPDGWLRLTGAPSVVIPLLSRNGVWDGGPIDEHSLVLIVGNAASGTATRIEGRSIDIDRIVDLLVNAG